MTTWPKDWLRSVLPLAVLAEIRDGSTYGYGIGTALDRSGFGAVKGGTLYPLLARLESDGLVESRWEAGDSGPGRKHFALTALGEAHLADGRDAWVRFSRLVGTALDRKSTTE